LAEDFEIDRQEIQPSLILSTSHSLIAQSLAFETCSRAKTWKITEFGRAPFVFHVDLFRTGPLS